MSDVPTFEMQGLDTPGGGVTELIIEIFRLNGRLLAAGDVLADGLGLTSSRWQVLGAMTLSPVPLPVAHIARNMGLTRQAVQRTVDEMRAQGFLRLTPNPHHQRASLVVMTEKGETAHRLVTERQQRWASRLAEGLSPDDLNATAALLRELRSRLDRVTDTEI